MHSVGEVVVYGVQGVCRIHELCRRKFDRVEKEYYLLRPVFDERSVIYVPIDKPDLVEQMRPVLTKQEVNILITDLSGSACDWIDDDGDRKDFCAEVIRSGDRGALMRLITMLYSRNEALKGQKKHFHIADERNLKRAQKLLHEEFAYVLGLMPDEVPGYISARI